MMHSTHYRLRWELKEIGNAQTYIMYRSITKYLQVTYIVIVDKYKLLCIEMYV